MSIVKYLSAGTAVLAFCVSAQATASGESSAYDQLREKLAVIDTLHANFEQQVFDERGELQETLEGELTLKRPHFLRWETSVPDHSIMIADGEAVWYYNAFVEQLSIFDQAQDLEQNPMLVLLSGDESAWQRFEVTYADDFWHVREQESNYAQVSLAVAFSADNKLETLRIDDGQGQVSVFSLSDVRMNDAVSDTLFSLSVENHVEIDDQRAQ